MIYRVTELLKTHAKFSGVSVEMFVWFFWVTCDLCYFFVLLSVKNASHVVLFPRLCLCSVQVFFFVCETPPLLFVLSCSWLYRRRWDSSSWFRAAFQKIGRAEPVLIFCGHRLRLHPCALLLALQLLWGSLQRNNECSRGRYPTSERPWSLSRQNDLGRYLTRTTLRPNM